MWTNIITEPAGRRRNLGRVPSRQFIAATKERLSLITVHECAGNRGQSCPVVPRCIHTVIEEHFKIIFFAGEGNVTSHGPRDAFF